MIHPASSRAGSPGFGIIESLISIGLLSLIAAGTTEYFAQNQKAMKQNRTYTYRDILVNQVARFAADGKSLGRSSAFAGGGGFPDNSAFQACANGGSGPTGCVAGTDLPMVLTDSFGNVVAGTPSVPRYYDLLGQPCSTGPSPECGIQVFTRFKADCGGGALTCPRARAVTVTFNVRQAPGLSLAPLASIKPFSTSFVNQIPLYVSRTPGTVNHLPVWTTNTDLGDSSLVQSGTSLGVNTTTPLAALHVVPIGTGNGALIEGNAVTGVSPRLGFVDTSLGTVTSAPTWLMDNAQDFFRIFRQPNASTPGFTVLAADKNGNVGFGPVQASDLWAQLTLLSDDPANEIQNDIRNTSYSDLYNPAYTLTRARGSVSSPLPLLAGDPIGTLNVYGFDGAGFASAGSMRWTASTDLTGANDSSYFTLTVSNSATGTNVAAMSIDSQSRVGFPWIPGDSQMEVWGNIRTAGTGVDCLIGNGSGATNCSSDARLKEHVVPIDHALEKVLQLQGMEFDWNSLSGTPGVHDSGVIAQEVEKVFPTAVQRGQGKEGEDYRKVDYAVLLAPLIESFHELQGLCGRTPAEIAANSRIAASLEAKVARQGAQLEELARARRKLLARNAGLRARIARLEGGGK